MHGGYIKLHRKLLEWCWYDDDTVFRLFIHILLKANYRAVKWHDITIERGQLLTSTVKLSEELHRGRSTIVRAIEKLESSGVIKAKSTPKYTLITILNYEKYQEIPEEKADNRCDENRTTDDTSKRTTDDTTETRSTSGFDGSPRTTDDTSKRTTADTSNGQLPIQQADTSKEVKEYKEEKEYKEVSSTDTAPPTTTSEQDLIDLYGIKAVEKYKKRFETWKQKKGARVKCIPTIAEWMKKDKVPKKTAEVTSSFDSSYIDEMILAEYD